MKTAPLYPLIALAALRGPASVNLAAEFRGGQKPPTAMTNYGFVLPGEVTGK